MKPHDEDTALYRALREKMTMKPEQAARLERRIMQQAKGAASPAPEAPQPAAKPQQTEKMPQTFGRYWQSWRALPLAACLVIACGGGFWIYRNAREAAPPDAVQYSSQEIAEQTLPAEPALTDASAATTTAPIRTTAPAPEHTTHITTAQTVTETRAPETTAAAQETQSRTEPPASAPPETAIADTETIPQIQTDPQLIQTEPPETVTTAFAVQTTADQPETTAPQAKIPDTDLYCADYTAAAGEEITVLVVFTHEMSFAGIQFSLDLPEGTECTGFSTDLDDLMNSHYGPVECNLEENRLLLACGIGYDAAIPAGAALLRIQLRIPEDAAPGTEYILNISDARQKIAFADGGDMTPTFTAGKITVR